MSVADDQRMLMPDSLQQWLQRLGLQAHADLLAPHLAVLPERTAVNLNTADAEVLAAVLDISDMGLLTTLVRQRSIEPLVAISELRSHWGLDPPAALVAVGTHYFEATVRLNSDAAALEERALIYRSGSNATVVRHRRFEGSVGF